MRAALAGLVLAAFATGEAVADDLVSIRAASDRLLTGPDGAQICFPAVVGSASAHVINYTFAGQPVSTAIQKRVPVLYNDVIVEPTGEPALLVLINQGETVWRLHVKRGARLAGVYMIGVEKPSILGLPRGTPVGRRYSSNEETGRLPACYPLPGAMDRISWDMQNRTLKSRLENAERQEEQARLVMQSADIALRELLASQPQAPGAVQGAQAIYKTFRDEYERTQKVAFKVRQEVAAFARIERREGGTEMPGVIHTLGNFLTIENAIKAEGPWPVVFLHMKQDEGTKPPVVSAANVRKFLAQKVKARAALDAMTPPLVALLPSNSLRVASPKDIRQAQALEMMAAAGYVLKNGTPQKYVNDAIPARAAALGVPYESWTGLGFMDLTKTPVVFELQDFYTILGPVTVPPNCGFSDQNIYIPEGAPEPEGDLCGARVYRETDLKLKGR